MFSHRLNLYLRSFFTHGGGPAVFARASRDEHDAARVHTRLAARTGVFVCMSLFLPCVYGQIFHVNYPSYCSWRTKL